MKKQLDALIDFEKTEGGIPGAAQNVLKSVRAAINQTLRGDNLRGQFGDQPIPQEMAERIQMMDRYAQANDNLSEILGSFNKLQEANGTKFWINDPEFATDLGNQMRTILTRYKSGTGMQSAIDSLVDTANKFGGDFGDDPVRLTKFNNILEDSFGSTRRGAFDAKVATGVKQGVDASMAGDMAIDAATNGGMSVSSRIKAALDGMRRSAQIKDEYAYQKYKALYDILTRGNIDGQ